MQGHLDAKQGDSDGPVVYPSEAPENLYPKEFKDVPTNCLNTQGIDVSKYYANLDNLRRNGVTPEAQLAELFDDSTCGKTIGIALVEIETGCTRYIRPGAVETFRAWQNFLEQATADGIVQNYQAFKILLRHSRAGAECAET